MPDPDQPRDRAHRPGPTRFGRSLRAAAGGLAHAFRTGPNLRLQALAGTVALSAALALGLGRLQIAVLALTSAVVLAAETANTAIERLCDLVDDEHGLGIDPRIRVIKDVAAGAVLLTALGSVVVGAAVFGPALLDLLDRILLGTG